MSYIQNRFLGSVLTAPVFLGVIIDRIRLVTLGSTKGTDQVLKKNVQADEGNPGQPRCEVFH
jgi:hypothetical protein